MILADTSVWIEHLRRSDERIAALLVAREVLVHPFVIGEIALGYLRSREAVLHELKLLPQAAVATHEEVLHLIERHRLFGTGLGYVDVHLLAAARLMGRVALWTYDERLRAAAGKLNLEHGPPI
ncbi:MAG: type II toxin-antitoxin system VapC family toxin [Xanthobacteraceae bacterium]|nr:type II toxin-antitoxin system VapC family toxin [Xanthobacteraceae bacterium]